MNRIIPIAIVLVLVGLLLWWGFSTQIPANIVPAIDFNPVVSSEHIDHKTQYVDISVDYPISSNEEINRALKSYANGQVDYFKGYGAEDVGDNPDAVGYSYSLMYGTYQSKHTVSYVFNDESYTGGAHGNRGITIFIFDKSTGQKLSLENIFVDGYFETLRQRIRSALNNGRGMAFGVEPTELDPHDVDFGTDEPAKLENTMYITDDAIVFEFSPYQVAPYAAGPVTLKFNRSELKDLLRKDW